VEGEDNKCSAFVAECVKEIGVKQGGVALDIPCGRGRHSQLLAAAGMTIVAADLHMESLHALARHAMGRATILPVRVNAEATLPFKVGAFDICLMIHFPLLPLATQIIQYLKPGGLLVLETFGAHGENWRMLPAVGQVFDLLSRDFSFLRYQESSVGKRPGCVTLRAVAQKRLGSGK
jgi:SAM-dependent methyltransferase